MNIKSYDFYYVLRSLKCVEAVWLYGSRARQDNQERSDMDLAVICPTATEEEWAHIQRIVREAKTLYKIDLVRFDLLPEGDRLRDNILKDHKVLFERKPNSYPWYESFLDLREALEQLKEMVQEPETVKSYVRDATIQRFEFCVELFWKTLKKICVSEGFDVTSPKTVLEKTFEMKLLDEEDVWLEMLEDRNMTSHTYKRTLALAVYYKVDAYYKHMHRAYEKIQKRYHL